jgi:hypothetical protein
VTSQGKPGRKGVKGVGLEWFEGVSKGGEGRYTTASECKSGDIIILHSVTAPSSSPTTR